MYLGDFAAGATVRFKWNSFSSAGASITRGTNGTISVYKDDGTTQDTSGITDTEDFDSTTGLHHCSIDLSADGTFYSAGSDFQVVLTGAAIDSQTVNAVLAHFSIANRPVQGIADGILTAAKFASDFLTAAKVATDVGTEIAAAVWGAATRVLTAGTNIVLAKGTGVTGFNDLDAAGVRTAVGLASANLDTQLSTIDSNVDSILDDTGTSGVAIADDAISAGKLASGTITASKFGAGAITSTVLATDCITGAKIAADSIGSSEIATSALTAIATAVGTQQMTESYAADGTAPTRDQALFAIQQGLLEFVISDTTITTKKLDKSTTAMTHTLDDATTPTSRTRAT